jgi:DNA-binding NarL/FixJ family response regulator
MTTILLADDHTVVRRGLRQLLEAQKGWRVCAEAEDGRAAVALALEHRPDVAVLDLAMPKMNGIDATQRIRAESPGTEVLIFSMHDSEHLVHQALTAGARGFVLKSDAAEHVVAAIESLAQGQPYMTSMVTQTMLDLYRRNSGRDPGELKAPKLSPREREIVQLLVEGMAYKEVAATLSISPKTVETHRATILRKLELSTIADLVRYAIRNGIIQA